MVGARAEDESDISRRGFIGWGATILTAAVIPGAAVVLVGSPAEAAVTPYALSSWQALVAHWVVAAAPGHPRVALQVMKVTDLSRASPMKMTGDVFAVKFRGVSPLPSGTYSVSTPGLGTLPLFLRGDPGTAEAIINCRVPARG